MNIHTIATWTKIGMLVGIVGFSVPTAFAQQETAISVSPITFEFSVNPGDKVTNQIKVTNLTNAPMQLETRKENILGTGDQGQVKLTEDETPYSLSSWIQTTPAQFTLAPKEVKIVTFTVTVPPNAEPGGHYGSILVGTMAGDTGGGTGSAVIQRLGSLALVKVSGNAKEDGLVTKFSPKNFVGSWEEVTSADGKTKTLVARDEKLTEESTRHYFSQGPVAFDLRVQNNGNVHIKPVGYVTIYNLFNRKVAELAIDSRNVFPGNDRQTTVIYPRKQLWGVYYRAQMVSLYGASNNKTLTASTSFWAFPLPAAIGIGILLLLVLIFHRRLNSAVRVLFRGR